MNTPPALSKRTWKVLLALGVFGVAALLARARKDDLKELGVSALLEGPAQKRSYGELRGMLDQAGVRLDNRFAAAPDTDANRDTACHIIGIERWGQARLRVLCGEGEYVTDRYHSYRPAEDLSLPQLRELASITRAQTSQLTRQLGQQDAEHQPAHLMMVPHNTFGPLSAPAWLRYLTLHADLESRRMS